MNQSIQWCAKIKDEVEKLAYQLNEETERTERPIRRLTVKITPSCCLSEKWRIINLLDEIWMLLSERSNNWEVGGRQQCDKNSYPGFSSGRPRGTHPQMTGTLSYRPEETGGRQREKSLDTRNRQLVDRISRFTVARRLHGGGLFARRSVRCVPLTPAHRRRRFLWCREHRNWRVNEWGRVLFTD
ncbi:hypothetical protein TNCV_618041 [Trichonephila clavipes]|nr:hypothetical protein TNCV_618041 [Trichonephila clavipes]